VNIDLGQLVGKRNEECWMELDLTKHKMILNMKVSVLLPKDVDNKEMFAKICDDKDLLKALEDEIKAKEEADAQIPDPTLPTPE
jgi:hypothetical protein